MRKLYFFFILTLAIYFGCKSQNNISRKSEVKNTSQEIEDGNVSINDTIFAFVNDTIIMELPVKFSRGLIWKQSKMHKDLLFLFEDEIQRLLQQSRQDFQRFHYVAKDTLNYLMTYRLEAPYNSESISYETKSKYFIIQKNKDE